MLCAQKAAFSRCGDLPEKVGPTRPETFSLGLVIHGEVAAALAQKLGLWGKTGENSKRLYRTETWLPQTFVN